MNGCRGATSQCDGLDVLPVRLGLDRRVRPFCAVCRYATAGLGSVVVIVERRLAAKPVDVDRRLRRPTWLTRLVARDTTGAILHGGAR